MPEQKTSGLDQAKRGLQDDHDPNDLGQKSANKPRGASLEKSQKEGPAAYAPHREDADIRSTSGDPAKKKTGEF
jgi:hypothetical protein